MLSLKTLLRLVIGFWLYCSWKHISHGCTLQFHSQVIYHIPRAHLTGRLSHVPAAWLLRMADKHPFFEFFLILPASCDSPVSCERLRSHLSSFSCSGFQALTCPKRISNVTAEHCHGAVKFQVLWEGRALKQGVFDVKKCNLSLLQTLRIFGGSPFQPCSLSGVILEREEW